jgi:hypothetical protein
MFKCTDYRLGVDARDLPSLARIQNLGCDVSYPRYRYAETFRVVRPPTVVKLEANWQIHDVCRADIRLEISDAHASAIGRFFAAMRRTPTWPELVAVLAGTWSAPAIPDGSSEEETG